jgi:hypothetical protein
MQKPQVQASATTRIISEKAMDLVSDSTLFQTLRPNQKRLLSHVKQCATADEIWKACRKRHRITIASDGGLKGNRSTFGWTISTPSNTVLLEGAGPMDGPYNVASSTRSEIGGFTAPLLILTLLSQMWGMQHRCKVAWVCDSKAALANVEKSTSRDHPPWYQPNNDDLLSQVKSMAKQLGRPIQPIWIKGHQVSASGTQSQNNKNIDRNNRADELATWYRDHATLPQTKEMTPHSSEERISISINCKRLVSQVDLRGYLQQRFTWSDATWNTIDLLTFGRFFKKLPPSPNGSHKSCL